MEKFRKVLRILERPDELVNRFFNDLYLSELRIRGAQIAGYPVINGRLTLTTWRLDTLDLEGCFLNNGCVVDTKGEVNIGDDVALGPGVKVLSSSHDITSPERRAGETRVYSTVIEKGAFVGGGSVILPGVRIGEGSVVGAGSVVTKDVAPHTVVAGNPARMLRELDR